MKQLLRKLSNIGIKPDMQAVDIKILGLMNRVILLSMGVFLFVGTINVFDDNYEPNLLSLFNFFGFGFILFLHYKNYYPKSKHIFGWYGVFMVTFVNIIMPAKVTPQFNYITGVVFTMLIFRDKKPANFYILLYLLSYLFTLWYRASFPPLYIMDAEESIISAAIVPIITIFIVSYGSLVFFKSLNQQYESSLLANNKLLKRQKQEIELQANLLNSKNEELNQSNEELNTTLDQLKEMQEHMLQQEKMASLGQLTAGIAHEINNPVNFVSANVSPLKKDFSELLELITKLIEQQSIDKKQEVEQLLQTYEYAYLTEEIDSLLNGMEEGAERTKKIVAGLRSFSRSNQTQRKLYDINRGIEVTLDLLNHRIKHSIKIKTTFSQPAEIWCNPDQINQVLMNVLSNAIDAMDEKGNLEISTHFNKESKSGNDLHILIKDDGIGMSEKTKRKIFDPFFTTKGIGKGTGLGLSISYGIVQDHGGSISVISTLGEGSTFDVRLPVTTSDT